MGNADSQFQLQAWDHLEGVPDPVENMRLVGHDAMLDRFAAALASGNMHHAWLVTGPRGIGKATFAARLAGHMFRHGLSAEPPDRYLPPDPDDPNERRIARLSHPNLLLLRRPWNDRDKKWRSELTVDEVRRSIGFFGSAAAESGWRVAIVDTADDMNPAAANALLKVLEEPPPRTLFLILAHSWRGMLSTIRSRCQTVTLRPLSGEQVIQALRRLDLLPETDEADNSVLASLSGGSVRRAILILQSDGLELYHRFNALTAGDSPDWGGIHELAGELAPVARNDRYRLLFDFAHDHVQRRLRGLPDPGGKERADGSGPISALAGWVEVWEKVRRSVDRTDAYNLDRKQAVLNLFAAFHGQA